METIIQVSKSAHSSRMLHCLAFFDYSYFVSTYHQPITMNRTYKTKLDKSHMKKDVFITMQVQRNNHASFRKRS